MSLKKINEPYISQLLPWSDDPFDRQLEGELLTKLIKSLTGPYVISVKSKWGSGKSIFLQRLARHLENNDVPVISINAWRNDFLEDPIIAFLAAIKNRLAPNKKVSQKTGAVITGLARHGAKLIAPITSVAAGVLLPGSGQLVKLGADAVTDIGAHLLAWEDERKGAEIDFLKKLESARDILTHHKKGDQVKPVVIMVDELDRCRPDFSVKVLERIKHYFNVDGLVFLIATDGVNLPDSVSSIYGPKINGEMYLRKFFDFEYRLKEPSPEKFIKVLAEQFQFDLLVENSSQQCGDLITYYECRNGNAYSQLVARFDRGLDAFEVLAAFPVISKLFKLSLRDQAQAFTIINAYLKTCPASSIVFPQALVFSVCMRFYDHRIYEGLRDGEKTITDAWVSIRTDQFRARLEEFTKTSVGVDVQLFMNAEVNKDVRAYINQILQSYHGSNDQFGLIQNAATNRLQARASICEYEGLKSYLQRSLSMTDAFL